MNPDDFALHRKARWHLRTSGAFCLIVGLLQLLSPPEWYASGTYHFAFKLLSLRTWGVLFLITSVVAIAAAEYHHPQYRHIALAALVGISAAWGMSLAMSFFGGTIQGAGAPVSWLFIAVLHMIEAGRPGIETRAEPRPPPSN